MIINLKLVAADDGQPAMPHRIKALLKRLLRNHGIKCIGGSIEDDGQIGEQTSVQPATFEPMAATVSTGMIDTLEYTTTGTTSTLANDGQQRRAIDRPGVGNAAECEWEAL